MKILHPTLGALFSLVLALPAFAHAHLDSATPAGGAKLTVAPKEIVLVFTEKLEPSLSALVVKDADGKQVETAEPESDGDNAASLKIRLLELAPGTYSVEWQATSVDTHSTTGSYSFTLD